MKAWLLLVAVAACSSPDPHQVVACEGYLTVNGQPFTGTCELACQKADANGQEPSGHGGTCTADHGPSTMPQEITCPTTFDFSGTIGCCSGGTDGKADVEFYVCKGQ